VNKNVRSAKVSIQYKNSRTNKKYSLGKFIDSFIYTDNATGDSDTVDVTLSDYAMKLIKSYYPGKNDMMSCSITAFKFEKNKKKFVNSQKFHVDKFGYTAAPGQLTLQGIAIPKNSAFSKTPRSKTWKSTTLKSIAKQLCKKAGISLHYSADTIKIKKVEQSDTTDLSFITSQCETYGLGIKIYADKLIIFKESTYENKKPVATIKPKDIIEGSFSADVELIRSYTGFKFTYKVNKKEVKDSHYFKNIKPKILVDIGECDSKEDGYRKGKAKVNEANKDMQTISFQILGNHKIMATSTIKLLGYGHLNGKYYIKQVRHEYSAESGYTQSIEARKVIDRL
jgi:phage protein D